MTATLNYRLIPVTPFQQNCSLLWCARTRRGAFVDPGGEEDRLLQAAEAEGVTIEKLLLTHGHLDHAGAAAALRERLDVPIEGPHEGDRFLLEGFPAQCRMFGFPPAPGFTPDRWLNQGDSVTVGELTLDVLHCPGHTPGHVVFHHAGGAESSLAFVGDVLFQGSIGRTDFPQGDHAALIRAIRTRLWPLGDNTGFVPGHGPMSTFGAERRRNPFVADHLFGRGS